MADCGEKCAEDCSFEYNEDRKKGVCAIKPEFIVKEHVRFLAEECLTEADKQKVTLKSSDSLNESASEEPPTKKAKSDEKKDKLRGQNKARPPPFKAPREANLCPWIVDRAVDEPEKPCENKKCTFMHDRAAYLKIKPEDMGEECILFNMTGRCPRGAACRLGSKHLTPEGLNIVHKEKFEEYKKKPLSTKNQLPKSLQNRLRKHKYDFRKAEQIVKANDPSKKKNSGKIGVVVHEKKQNSEEVESSVDSAIAKQSEPIVMNNKTDETELANGNGAEVARNNVEMNDPEIIQKDINLKSKNGNLGAEHKNDLEGQISESTSETPARVGTKSNGTDLSDVMKNSVAENKSENKQNEISLELKTGNIDEDSKETLKREISPKVPETTSKIERDSRIGPVSDYDLIKPRASEKKTIDWKDKILLSPLTTLGNLPFRRICKEYGADLTCGEMALAPKILKGANEEWALVKRHESENIFGVQLCGNNPGVLTRCAQLLEQEIEVDFIDLNLGCPIDLIYKQGGGSGMLNRMNVLENVIKSVSQVMTIPLTVKTRMGVYMDKPVAHNLTPKFRDWGASMITVHGRSREQRYTKSADWEYIERCAQAAKPIPIYGNGDILSFEDYRRVRASYPTIQGVTIGRGALIKPWIFTEIKEQKLRDVPTSERLEILKKYSNYGLEHWGSDTRGVETTRRFMLEWISFLHRYIPVGILERPPQKINERPPYFRGRDEMETLLASSNCADWIKISEMFLGKVPEGFHFLPKHKANSWK